VDPLDTVRDEDKVEWLMRIDADTRRIDPRVKQVMASLAAVHEVILIASSDGTLTADVRPLGAPQRVRHRRTEWPARAGLQRRRRALRSR
jgi:predicted Zn-dependent protease